MFNVKVVALFNKARKFENLMLLNLSSSFVFVQLFFLIVYVVFLHNSQIT